jgi:glycosyltransferase involved in cell wall biosynthesis
VSSGPEIRLIVLSKYDTLGASSRLRFYQYLNFFKANGVVVAISPLFSNTYLNNLYAGENIFFQVLVGYFKRLLALFSLSKYDIIVLEKELFPYLPYIFEKLIFLSKKAYIVDYDDAIFHNYDLHPNPFIRSFLGKKIDLVMKGSSFVLTGNEYLASRALNAGSFKVKILPTVVDTNKYSFKEKPLNDIPIIGWIGSPKTSHYLKYLIPVFNKIVAHYPCRFIAVGANEIDFENTIVETVKWTETTEISLIQNFDIGIMPLHDTPWENGKCGYKLIQCMACGIPVVASNVGVNSSIISHNYDGYLVNSHEEWVSYLSDLILNPTKRFNMGQSGRDKILDKYSLQIQSGIFINVIQEVFNDSKQSIK